MRSIKSRIFRAGIISGAGLMAVLGCGLASAEHHDQSAAPVNEAGYSLGHMIGSQTIAELGDIDRAAFVQGFSDAVSGGQPALSADAMRQALMDFEAQRSAAAQEALAAVAEANSKAGDAYRDQFAQQEGVESLANGLLYKVIEAGSGDPPETGAPVTIHYKGSLVDGTEFDDSFARDEPITVELDRVLPGWSAALERMPVGARWQVVIPPSLAYGETGAGGFIEPNTTLIFEFERLANS